MSLKTSRLIWLKENQASSSLLERHTTEHQFHGYIRLKNNTEQIDETSHHWRYSTLISMHRKKTRIIFYIICNNPKNYSMNTIQDFLCIIHWITEHPYQFLQRESKICWISSEIFKITNTRYDQSYIYKTQKKKRKLGKTDHTRWFVLYRWLILQNIYVFRILHFFENTRLPESHYQHFYLTQNKFLIWSIRLL